MARAFCDHPPLPSPPLPSPSSALKKTSEATKTSRLASFPDYLVVQVNKFTVADDWTPKKLDVVIDAPNELDLTPYRGRGLQPGEEELPEEEEAQSEEGTPPALPPRSLFV